MPVSQVVASRALDGRHREDRLRDAAAGARQHALGDGELALTLFGFSGEAQARLQARLRVLPTA